MRHCRRLERNLGSLPDVDVAVDGLMWWWLTTVAWLTDSQGKGWGLWGKGRGYGVRGGL